jgi:hypothetical protein
MQRDGIVKSLEQLIPQAQPAFNAHRAAAQGPEQRYKIRGRTANAAMAGVIDFDIYGSRMERR